MKKRYYLAYGSNLNKAQMAYRCPDAKAVGTCTLEGYELVFRRGYLTIEKKEGSVLHCGVWSISHDDEVSLDRYEGYPTFYRKEDVRVTCSDGVVRNCLVYVMNNGFPIQPPNNNYFYPVMKGYKEFGIDTAELVRAYERAKWPDD